MGRPMGNDKKSPPEEEIRQNLLENSPVYGPIECSCHLGDRV